MATEPGPAGHSQLKPTLRKAERLSAVHTPEGLPLPPNAVADVQRNTRGWLCCQLDQRYRGSSSETFKAARDRAVSPRNCSTSARPALMIVGAATEATEAHRRAEPIVRMQSPPAVSLRTTGSSAANTPELSGFEQGTDLRHPPRTRDHKSDRQEQDRCLRPLRVERICEKKFLCEAARIRLPPAPLTMFCAASD